MFEPSSSIPIRKQAKLLEVPRTKLYYKPIINDDSIVANMIMEAYLSSDCRYGYRKITASLLNCNIIVNSKKVLRIMNELGLEGLYPRKHVNTSMKNNENKIYPYLLTDLEINKKDQVWATDITYIKINGSFMYFIAIIDLYSRYIITYGLSHSLEAEFCITTLENALKMGIPIIFNSDQGCQFTSNDFINKLLENGIKISMDHTGRCFDNIFVERLWRTLKQEVIYYYRPENITSLENRLNDFVPWYNNHRLHQSLKYKTPASLYLS